MPTIERKLAVCDFCFLQHQEYIKGDNFDDIQKRGITKCTSCSGIMCQPCYEASMQEIKWSILASYGFALCRQCIVDYRRTTDMQEEMEEFIDKEIEAVKVKMKKHIYLRNKQLQWQQF